MNEILIDDQENKWLSTYGVITIEPLLARFNIFLPQDELLSAMKNTSNFYNQLLQIPLKNVLCGIILQQCKDYHIYTQKLFIDYLLSGEGSKSEESQGASLRESLEAERKELIALGDRFNKQESTHDELIASSQSSLIAMIRDWLGAFESGMASVIKTLKRGGIEEVSASQVRKALTHAVVNTDNTKLELVEEHLLFVDKMAQKLDIRLSGEQKNELIRNLSELIDLSINLMGVVSHFSGPVEDNSRQMRTYRTEFYQGIIRVTELIKLLPDYRINPEQDAINREPLYFDKSIGGN